MWDLKVCTVCLSAQGNLFNIDRCNLRIDYNWVSGLQTYEGNDLPGFLCVECTAYVKRCKSFRDKCQRAYFALQEILQQENEITPARIQAINRNSLSIMPSLAFSDPRRSKYETTEFTWTKRKRPSVSRIEDVTIMQCNTHEDKTCGTRPRKKPKLREKIKSESDDEGVKEELDNTFDSDDNYFGDFTQHNDDRNIPTDTDLKPGVTGTEDQVEESTVDEEYATIVPISMTEAKAALEITKTYTIGKFKCEVCTRGFIKKNALETHARMHDKHLNGRFVCDLCDFYYKTELMLNSHMTEKHMFKYICKKCPVVHFERTTAKQHFIRSHLQERDKKSAGWYESKPAWVGGIRAKVPQVRGIAKSKASRGGKNSKGAARSKTALTAAPQGRPRSLQLPKDVIQVTPISPLDQYRLVRDRQYTSNYKTSPYQCEYCYRGYREYKTYNKHMQKHDEKVSGPLQCDMCKLHFRTPLQVYVHMATTHLHRYSCLKCEFVCYNRCQAITHYRWHKNVVYKCGQCDLVFKKASTRGTHIRLKHPSTDLCNICGHSFVSKSGLLNHLKKSHTREEVAKGKAARIDKTHGLYCSECEVQFLNDAAFSTHLGSSSKHSIINVPIQSKMRDTRVRRRKRPNNELVVNVGQPTGHDCEICGIPLPNDVKAREHYLSEHPGHEFLKRYMCDVCGHATKNYSNLEVHMRTHTHEKPYACTHCDRRFTMSSSRDRHLVVHTGERRYECEHCHRRFTQSNTLKLHIQTVHLKIPYAPWDKKNRKRRKEMEEPQSELKLMMMDAVNERIS